MGDRGLDAVAHVGTADMEVNPNQPTSAGSTAHAHGASIVGAIE